MIKKCEIALWLLLLLPVARLLATGPDNLMLQGQGKFLPITSGEIRAGIGRVVITPSLPMWMTGYADRHQPANGVVHDLWAKALAVKDDRGGLIVIVTTDLLGLSHEISEAVFRQVSSSRYGIQRSQLLLNSSHTHSGPMIWPCLDVIYDFSAADQRTVSLYAFELTRKLIAVIDTAMNSMVPATLSTGHAVADFAINRRNDIHPNGPVDHDVPVLSVAARNGGRLAILFGYACHNTTMVNDNFLINGDYAGFAQLAIEKNNPGVMAMFLMGCAGDQNPAPRGTLDFARQHGEALAEAVQKALSQNMRPVHAPIRTAYTVTDLNFQAFDLALYQKDIVGDNPYFQRRARLMLEAYNKGWSVKSFPYPVQAVRFSDDMTILALSDEVVVDYSLKAKKEFSGENLFVSGYSHEVMCYIPSLRVLREGGYEAADNMIYYGMPGPFADDVEDRVWAAVRKVMRAAGATISGINQSVKPGSR
jgi:neutral ceramidase